MSSARAAREIEQRRGKGSRESARGFQWVAWSCGRRPGEEEAARQGGGGRGAWPRAPPSSFGARGRKTTGGEAAVVGWAALEELGQAGKSGKWLGFSFF